jgi:putative ATPase
MRPRDLSEFVGQIHLLGPGGPLAAMIRAGASPSMLLWGPPGTGKTTLAHLTAAAIEADFVALSAINATVADIRATIATATERRADGRRTVLFLDEMHRFDKRQQDTLLRAVESGVLTLIGATTESPFSSINEALLSRMRLFRLSPLGEADLRALVDRALVDERGLAGRFDLSAEAATQLLEIGGGDARRTLDFLETAAIIAGTPSADLFTEGAAASVGKPVIDLVAIEAAAQQARVDYDSTGCLSAFIKSVRGNDPDGALYWLATMLVAGEDPRVITRRLVISSGEDIGAADPRAMQVAVAAAQAVEVVGMPELQYVLANATVLLACMPKSPRAGQAYFAIRDLIEAGGTDPVPAHLRTGSKRYRDPRKADQSGPRAFWIDQQYLPDALASRRFYEPSEAGLEAQIAARLARLRGVDRPEGQTKAEDQEPKA